jgi:hypothetical protein
VRHADSFVDVNQKDAIIGICTAEVGRRMCWKKKIIRSYSVLRQTLYMVMHKYPIRLYNIQYTISLLPDVVPKQFLYKMRIMHSNLMHYE